MWSRWAGLGRRLWSNAMTTPANLPAVIPTADLALIEVPIDALAQPHLPLILADAGFLSTLKTVESQVTALRISDTQSAQQAADLLARLTTAGKKLNETRLALNRPFQAQQDRINELAKAPAARIENLKQSLKVAQTNYANKVQREADEAEKAKQAEIKRLESIAKLEREREDARLAEIERQAEEARSKQKFEVIDDDEPAPEPDPTPPELTPTEKALEAVRYAPVPVVAKASGVSFKTTLVPVVVDLMALPEHFVERIAKIGAIRSTFCTGWKAEQPLPVCPGVKFEVKKEPVSTGKGAF